MCYENSLRSGVKGNCLQTGQHRGGEGRSNADCPMGVSGELSWVSKPITRQH